ncbi:MAG: hypothetical protein HYW24_00150 [Candidatus Aenigmarchaeota archaeon]|nr:hypothetical protein [Candidatus Aenigmarchaeota archaeon]
MEKLIYSAYELADIKKRLLGKEPIPLWDVVFGFGVEQRENRTIREILDKCGQNIAIGPLNGKSGIVIYSLL